MSTRRHPERRTTKDRRAVTRGGRRNTDAKDKERELRIAQQLEWLRQQGRPRDARAKIRKK
jgi:hypothetical protein